MRKTTLLALFIVSALFISSSAYGGNIDLDFTEYKPLNASVRSALMPGWGQGWNGQTTKAWITFGVFAVSTIGAFYFNHKAESRYEKYEASPIYDEKYYNEYEDNYTTSQVLTFVAVGTWIYSVIDAYFVCKKQLKEKQMSASTLNFYYNRQNDGYYLTYSKKIAI